MVFKFFSLNKCYTLEVPFLINEMTNNTRNTKNKIFAIPAAAPAMPPNPKNAAMIANITNVIVQRNIFLFFKLILNSCKLFTR